MKQYCIAEGNCSPGTTPSKESRQNSQEAAVRAEDLKCHTVLQLVQCDYQRPELLAGPESL